MTCKRSFEFLKMIFLRKEVNSKDVKWRYFCPQNIRETFFALSTFIVWKLNRLTIFEFRNYSKKNSKFIRKSTERGKNLFIAYN